MSIVRSSNLIPIIKQGKLIILWIRGEGANLLSFFILLRYGKRMVAGKKGIEQRADCIE
jgi:hypothetical protein